MNGICRDNHFVAQMYFEPWKNNNNKIWTYDLVVPNEKSYLWNEKSIRSIAYQRDWYTRLEEGKEVDDIEKNLNEKFETPASIPLKKTVKGETLTDDDWEKIINYIGCQIVRTPSFASKLINDENGILKNAFENGVKEIEQKLKTISKDEIQSYSNNEKDDEYNKLFPLKVVDLGKSCEGDKKLIKIETILGKSLYLYVIKFLLENSIKYLHKHTWKVIQLDERVKIPTSDDPVICLNYYSKNNYDFGGGWGNNGSEIIFPISPSKIIYTKVGEKNIDFKPNYEMSITIKNIIIEHAYRRIFSVEKEKWITKKRKRIVDKDIFEKDREMFNNWHRIYKEYEVKYLAHNDLRK